MQPREMRREWLLLLVLSGIQFSQMVDFMVLMPLGTQLMREFGITPTQLGFFVSIYAVAASLSGFFSALVIDRFDRRAAMLALYAFFAATMAACALAPSYATLLAARTTAGPPVTTISRTSLCFINAWADSIVGSASPTIRLAGPPAETIASLSSWM